MGNLLIEDFCASDLKYNYSKEGHFTHNYDKDFQFVILWENGRKKEEEVLRLIKDNFEIKYCAEIIWSKKLKRANFNRLYSQQLDSKSNLNKHNRVGTGDFLCIVFQDPSPKYQYLKSLSGDIFIGNKNAVDIKYELREKLDGNLLHGTANLSEFFHHGSLLFHEKLLKEIISIKLWDGKIHRLEQDMAGAHGWNSFSEFFGIANYSSNWVVLRNHEFLPDDFWGNDKDIDLMCDDLKKFVSVANATKRKGGISAYETIVEGKRVLLDIRYLGDNYYNALWQSDMLNRKETKEHCVPILRDDDYFFSLLFHAKLQKKDVKDIYIERLLQLGRKIGLHDIDKSSILDNKKSAKILNGFLNEKNYYYTSPHDKRVYLNKSTFKYITAHPLILRESLKTRGIRFVSRTIPLPIKKLIPVKVKRIISK